MVGSDEKCGLANSLKLSETLGMQHYPAGAVLRGPTTRVYVGTAWVCAPTSVCVCNVINCNKSAFKLHLMTTTLQYSLTQYTHAGTRINYKGTYVESTIGQL